MALNEWIEKGGLVACPAETPAGEVAALMKVHDVGAVLVRGDDGKPAGVVTDRDLVVRCLAEESSGEKLARDIMSSPVTTIALADGIAEAVRRMGEAQVRRLVIVDEAGEAVGMLSADDVVPLLAKELETLSGAISPPDEKLTVSAA